MFHGKQTKELKRVNRVIPHDFIRSIQVSNLFLRLRNAREFLQRHSEQSTIVGWPLGEQVTDPGLQHTHGEWHEFILLCFMEKRGELPIKI
jgi:hypothetical protein